MDKKTYKKIQFVLIFLLWSVLGFFNSMDLWSWWVVVSVIVFMLVMSILWYMKNKVYDVIADERDEYIWWKAARYTLSTFIFISSLISIIISSIGRYEIIWGIIGICILLILGTYTSLFYYFNRKDEN